MRPALPYIRQLRQPLLVTDRDRIGPAQTPYIYSARRAVTADCRMWQLRRFSERRTACGSAREVAASSRFDADADRNTLDLSPADGS